MTTAAARLRRLHTDDLDSTLVHIIICLAYFLRCYLMLCLRFIGRGPIHLGPLFEQVRRILRRRILRFMRRCKHEVVWEKTIKKTGEFLAKREEWHQRKFCLHWVYVKEMPYACNYNQLFQFFNKTRKMNQTCFILHKTQSNLTMSKNWSERKKR